MNIETKFNRGSYMWQMHENKAVMLPVKSIGISVPIYGGTVIKYLCEDAISDRAVTLTEDEAFATKEELLASL